MNRLTFLKTLAGLCAGGPALAKAAAAPKPVPAGVLAFKAREKIGYTVVYGPNRNGDCFAKNVWVNIREREKQFSRAILTSHTPNPRTLT
jgi:hypothetical protein